MGQSIGCSCCLIHFTCSWQVIQVQCVYLVAMCTIDCETVCISISTMGPSSRECSLHPEARQSHSGTSAPCVDYTPRQKHNMSTSVAECWLFSLFLTGYLDFLAGEFCISEARPSQGRETKEKIRNSLYIWYLSSLTSGPGSVYHYKFLTHVK